ncbi:hypothetical protein HCB39_28535 [Salinispora arenicola]|nr:hypothetical protein [Salinispora arenicola]
MCGVGWSRSRPARAVAGDRAAASSRGEPARASRGGTCVDTPAVAVPPVRAAVALRRGEARAPGRVPGRSGEPVPLPGRLPARRDRRPAPVESESHG